MFNFFINNAVTSNFYYYYNSYLSFTNNNNKLSVYFNSNVKYRHLQGNYLFQKYLVNSKNANDSRVLVIQNLFDFKYSQLFNLFSLSLLVISFFFLVNFKFNVTLNLIIGFTFTMKVSVYVLAYMLFFILLLLISFMLVILNYLISLLHMSLLLGLSLFFISLC